jgi:hypothetical protein
MGFYEENYAIHQNDELKDSGKCFFDNFGDDFESVLSFYCKTLYDKNEFKEDMELVVQVGTEKRTYSVKSKQVVSFDYNCTDRIDINEVVDSIVEYDEWTKNCILEISVENNNVIKIMSKKDSDILPLKNMIKTNYPTVKFLIMKSRFDNKPEEPVQDENFLHLWKY